MGSSDVREDTLFDLLREGCLFRRLCSRTHGAYPRVSRPVLHDGLHCERSKLGYTNLSLFEYFSHAVAEVAI